MGKSVKCHYGITVFSLYSVTAATAKFDMRRINRVTARTDFFDGARDVLGMTGFETDGQTVWQTSGLVKVHSAADRKILNRRAEVFDNADN